MEETPTSATPVAVRVAEGLARISLALRNRAWSSASRAKLTPTQGQVLAMLNAPRGGLRLGALAKRLGISAPTASDAVSTLVAKGYVRKDGGEDRRAVSISLTDAGKQTAAEVGGWPSFLTDALRTLDPADQAAYLKLTIKLIRALQVGGHIDPPTMCVTCSFFRPWLHRDTNRPHHCALVDAPLADCDLRVECNEHEVADAEFQASSYRRWVSRDFASPIARMPS